MHPVAGWASAAHTGVSTSLYFSWTKERKPVRKSTSWATESRLLKEIAYTTARWSVWKPLWWPPDRCEKAGLFKALCTEWSKSSPPSGAVLRGCPAEFLYSEEAWLHKGMTHDSWSRPRSRSLKGRALQGETMKTTILGCPIPWYKVSHSARFLSETLKTWKVPTTMLDNE